MFWRSSKSNGTKRNDVRVRPNQKWEIQYGGLRTGCTNNSTCRQHGNEISTAIPLFSGHSYSMGLVVMLIDQTGSGKFENAASKLQIWPLSWISHFRFGQQLFQPLPPLNTENIGLTIEISFLACPHVDISVCHLVVNPLPPS